jgi:hypothetical protein
METPLVADPFVALLKKSGLLPAEQIEVHRGSARAGLKKSGQADPVRSCV